MNQAKPNAGQDDEHDQRGQAAAAVRLAEADRLERQAGRGLGIESCVTRKM